MSRPGRLGLGGLILITLSSLACRKPAAIDPAEEAFHKAVTRFAETSRLTQDLTYRDPRFDPILDALDQIPAGSDPKPRALALAERIRGARTLANSQERASELLQAQAEAPPAFEPQARLPPPASRKPSVTPESRPAPENPGRADSVTSGPIAKDPGKKLPSWYANYFGGADKIEDGGPGRPDATAVDSPNSPAPKKSAPGTESAGPPPVFGIPGPAGGALQGRPGTE